MNPTPKQVHFGIRTVGAAAFSLIELLVVVAIIAILASLLLPALSRTKSKAQGMKCVNNLKQFDLAWNMYNHENNDRVPPNNPLDSVAAPVSNTWVRGWIWLGLNQPDDTNTVFLTQSLLGPYLKQSTQIWRCPCDNSTTQQGGRRLPRVRTISMNCWLNCDSDQAWDTYMNYPVAGRIIRKTSDMINPGPSQTFVFTDERADSINDGYFALPMYPQGRTEVMSDWPGSYHGGAGTFSFADGHTQLHKWQDPRTTPPLQTASHLGSGAGPLPSPSNPDVAWLQAHATDRLP